MKIVVCIKQVPDSIEVEIDEETKRIKRESVKGIINPFDMYALEEALRLKERFGGETVVLTMGPPQAEEALREALAMGLDRAILVTDRAFAGSDTLATGYTLKCAIDKLGGADIVLCGKEAMDGSTGQVGPYLAETLSIPYVTFVSKVSTVENAQVECERLMEDHYETLRSPLPAVLTVVKEINEPRIPSLRGMLKAKKAEITKWTAEEIGGDPARFGQDGSPTRVVEVWKHTLAKEGKILEGEPDELAGLLLTELREKGLV